MNLKKQFDNKFDDDKRSQTDTFAGFSDHGVRFTGRVFGGGPVDAALTAAQTQTQALMAQVTAAQVAVGTRQAQQQVARGTTTSDRTAVNTRLKSNHAALQSDLLYPDATERARLTKLLYPQGLDHLTQADLRDLPDLLATYLQTTENEQGALGKNFLDLTKAALAPFATTRDQQIKQKGATSEARSDRRGLVDVLNEQLNFNGHLLCAHYRADLGAVASFYDGRYFDDAPAGHEGERRGRVDAGERKTVLDLGAADPAFVRVTLTASEGGPLEFARAASAAEPPTAWLPVLTGAPQTLDLSALPGAGPLLLVRNPTDKTGHYRVALGR